MPTKKRKDLNPSAVAPKNPHAVALGRRGGSVKSEAKAASSRKNGQKGGRRPYEEQAKADPRRRRAKK